jgi:hypothetical protein
MATAVFQSRLILEYIPARPNGNAARQDAVADNERSLKRTIWKRFWSKAADTKRQKPNDNNGYTQLR